jgi:hypothetical protein
MKTKRKTNRTRKNKGGHKVHYDYDLNIDAGTNKPLSGQYVHKNDCLACALYSLGFMTKDTARFLQQATYNGARRAIVVDMINDTYGEGHTFEHFIDEKSLKMYLQPEEATLGFFGGKLSDGFNEWGHFFIVFRAKNGKLYSIDSQGHTVTLLSTYLSIVSWSDFYVLKEPSIKRITHKFITVETIKKAINKDNEIYNLFLYPEKYQLPTDEELEKQYSGLLE